MGFGVARTSDERSTVDPDAGELAALRVFLNYRREETSGHAGRLFDDLTDRLGGSEVFMDIDRIAPGLDFVLAIDDALDGCDVVLALIGRRWADVTNADGVRRLDDPDDFVRLELEKALGRTDVRVIPVLVHGASMPSSGSLPEGLRSLARRQAFELSDTRWHYDLDMLVQAIEIIARKKTERARAAADAAAAEELARSEQARLAEKHTAAERAEQARLAKEEERRQEAALRREAEAERQRARDAERREMLERKERQQRERADRKAAAERDAAAPQEHAGVFARLERRRPAVLAACGGLALTGLALLVAGLMSGSEGGQAATRAPAPRAVADRVSLQGQDRYLIPARQLLGNDRGQALRLVGVRGGTNLHGALAMRDNRTSLLYTPDAGYDGTARFAYTARDANGRLAVAPVLLAVKGLTAAEKSLLSYVPDAIAPSCRSSDDGRGARAALRCRSAVGTVTFQSYPSAATAERAFENARGKLPGACDNLPATGSWYVSSSPGRVAGRYWCGGSRFGWTYGRGRYAAFVSGKAGVTGGALGRWFFEDIRLKR
jgi:TIR domain-containing protein/Big-like domain-containing protein